MFAIVGWYDWEAARPESEEVDVATADPSSASGDRGQAQQQAQEVAGQTQDKAQQAASQAKQQAQQVAAKARDRVRAQVDERSTQAGDQLTTQADDIRTIAEQLRAQGKDKPANVAQQAAERAERTGSYLRETDVDRILGDIEDFARQQPWAVIAGGISLGFAASRFLKASSAERYEQSAAQRQPSAPQLASDDLSPRVPVAPAAGYPTTMGGV